MAANIHLHQPRVEVALTEHDDTGNGEPATPDGQASPQSETSIAAPLEQHGQSGDGGGSDAGSHEPSTPPPPPAEAEASTPFPAQFRYGLGEVSIGRPEYVRFAANEADRAQQGTGEPSAREVAFAPATRAENTPPPFTLPALPANLFNDLPIPLDTTDFARAAPMQTAFTSVDAVAARMTTSALAGAPGASPATPAASATKPIPMPKPTGITPDASASLPLPATSPAPTITNAPRIGGQAVTADKPDTAPDPDSPPSTRQPYLTPGLHTAPEQSPHYANALAYGREHSYKDDEIMKLAVLMQNNGDASMGREWLSLKPDVLRAAVNAVVRNADNSFDTSGVFGGTGGYPDGAFASQRVPADLASAAQMAASPAVQMAVGANGHLVFIFPPELTPAQQQLINAEAATGLASAVTGNAYPRPDGWILVEETVSNGSGSSGDGGDGGGTSAAGRNGGTVLRYYRPSDEMIAARSASGPLLSALGYQQVSRGQESQLSVGCDFGYRDLSRMTFHPDFGLITTPDNFMLPVSDDDFMDRAMPMIMAVGFMAVTGTPATQFVETGVVAAGNTIANRCH
jgi:hypothetical protein